VHKAFLLPPKKKSPSNPEKGERGLPFHDGITRPWLGGGKGKDSLCFSGDPKCLPITRKKVATACARTLSLRVKQPRKSGGFARGKRKRRCFPLFGVREGTEPSRRPEEGGKGTTPSSPTTMTRRTGASFGHEGGKRKKKKKRKTRGTDPGNMRGERRSLSASFQGREEEGTRGYAALPELDEGDFLIWRNLYLFSFLFLEGLGGGGGGPQGRERDQPECVLLLQAGGGATRRERSRLIPCALGFPARKGRGQRSMERGGGKGTGGRFPPTERKTGVRRRKKVLDLSPERKPSFSQERAGRKGRGARIPFNTMRRNFMEKSSPCLLSSPHATKKTTY